MKINDVDRARGVGKTEKTRKPSQSSGTGFASMVSEMGAQEAPEQVAAAQPMNALGGLLAVQEVGDTLEQDRRQSRRGSQILDQLDNLRHEILEGEVAPHRLAALSHAVGQAREEVTDPRLAEVLDEIDLRARVEIAKLEAGSLAQPWTA